MVRVKGSTYGSYETPCMSFKEIGQRLKIPTKTAASYYYRGMNKLKQQPGALEGLIECVHAVAISEKEILQAGSLECQRDVCALYSDGASEYSNK